MSKGSSAPDARVEEPAARPPSGDEVRQRVNEIAGALAARLAGKPVSYADVVTLVCERTVDDRTALHVAVLGAFPDVQLGETGDTYSERVRSAVQG